MSTRVVITGEVQFDPHLVRIGSRGLQTVADLMVVADEITIDGVTLGKEETERLKWFTVPLWGTEAESAPGNFQEGTKIRATGTLGTRSWTTRPDQLPDDRVIHDAAVEVYRERSTPKPTAAETQAEVPISPASVAPKRVAIKGVVKLKRGATTFRSAGGDVGSRASILNVFVDAEVIKIDGTELSSSEVAKRNSFRIPLQGTAAAAGRALKVGSEIEVSGELGTVCGELGLRSLEPDAEDLLRAPAIFNADMSVHRDVSGEYASLLGLVARDPVLGRTPAGRPCVQLQMEDTSLFRDRDTTLLDTVCIVARDNQAHEVVSAFRKGDLLSIDGDLRLRRWTTEMGVERGSWEVERPRIQLAQMNRDAAKQRGKTADELLNFRSKPDWDPPAKIGQKMLATARNLGRKLLDLSRRDTPIAEVSR
jgi:single-stranded DNA-binding protein